MATTTFQPMTPDAVASGVADGSLVSFDVDGATVAFKKPSYTAYKEFTKQVLQHRETNPAQLVSTQEWLVAGCCVTHDAKSLAALYEDALWLPEDALSAILALARRGSQQQAKT